LRLAVGVASSARGATLPSDERYPPLTRSTILTRGGPLVSALASRTIRDTDHRTRVATVPVPATAAA